MSVLAEEPIDLPPIVVEPPPDIIIIICRGADDSEKPVGDEKTDPSQRCWAGGGPMIPGLGGDGGGGGGAVGGGSSFVPMPRAKQALDHPNNSAPDANCSSPLGERMTHAANDIGYSILRGRLRLGDIAIVRYSNGQREHWRVNGGSPTPVFEGANCG